MPRSGYDVTGFDQLSVGQQDGAEPGSRMIDERKAGGSGGGSSMRQGRGQAGSRGKGKYGKSKQGGGEK